MRKIHLTIIFICLLGKVEAQTPNWNWAKTMGGTDIDYGFSIAVDASGNIYTAGMFNGTVDFDPGVGTFSLTSAGGSDVFISKLDASGNFIWAKSIGGISDDESYSIAIDRSSNIYITGGFQNTVDFDPDSVGVFNLISAGLYDIFISKLDSSGNFIWARRIGGSDFDMAFSLALDTSDNIYTTGVFSATADFDPDSLGIFNMATGVDGSSFISKLDSSGNFVWAKELGGTMSTEGFWIATDIYSNVYTTGYFTGTTDFNPDPLGVFNLTSAGHEDIFISKLNGSGDFVWAKRIGGSQNDQGFSIALDASGQVYTTGLFTNTVDFNPDSTGNFNLTSGGGWDIFISKLDSSGNFLWAKAIGGVSSDVGYAISTDGSGSVYTTGSFVNTVDFNPGSGTFDLTSPGTSSIFISKLDSSGNFVWAKALGGTGADYAQSITLDATENIYITGYFNSTSISFDSISIANTDNSGATSDLFIAKLNGLVTRIEYVKNADDISVFPNPTTNYFTIDLGSNQNKVQITISDITGKINYTIACQETKKIQINIKDLSAGVYSVRIQTADFIETKKLIVEK